MELQAIRYAAMVSGMTFARAVDTYASLLAARSSTGGVSTEEARAKLLAFLKWDEPREDDFAQDVRIILVAADFSREITTAVLWLNERGLDIRCVRLKPYVNGQQTLIDAQQVVPLPEAEEYMVQMKEKEQAERSEQAARHSERRAFWTLVLPEITKATGKWKNCSPSDSDWIAAPSGVKGVRWVLRVRQNDCALDLYIDAGPGSQLWNKSVYDSLYSRRREIDSAFGGELSWFRLDGKQASCLTCYPDKIGYRSDREKWPLAARAFADCAKRLDLAVRPYLEGAADSATKNPIA